MLAVIGPEWLTTSTSGGAPRLEQEDDYVRLELSRALDRKLPVVPVLVGGAELPAAGDLPEDLRALVRRQAAVLRDETWHRDVAGLVARLQGRPDLPTRRRHRRIALAAAFLLVASGVGAWALWPGAEQPPTDDTPPPCPTLSPTAWNELTINTEAAATLTKEGGPLGVQVRSARWRELEPGMWRVLLTTSMENRTPEAVVHGYWNYDSLVVGRRAFDQMVCFSPDPEVVVSDTVGDALVGFDVRCRPTGHIELLVGEAPLRIDVTSQTLEPGPC